MKGLCRDIVVAFFAGVVIPVFTIHAGILLRQDLKEDSVSEHSAQTEASVAAESSLVILFRDLDGSVLEMGLDDYITGAVLGEMPASFTMEALKAQAVAARTYAWKAKVSGGKHGDGSVCGNYACCQAYISEAQYLESGGDTKSVDRIKTAVLATSDLVLTYEGNLIEATYFSCSGGKTEDAVAVWGSDVPYLRSVESPGEEGAAWYTDEITFTGDALEAALGIQLPELSRDWFGDITYTNGGGVETIRIGSELFSGTELRGLLKLRSTAFTVTVQEDTAIFLTRGYGHRVGMSQYGADAMAAAGADYAQILAHYYPGTELMKLQ